MPVPRPCPRCGAELPADAAEGLCPGCLLSVALCPEGGPAEWAAPVPAELARCFPNLEILGEIGRGGMGIVYQARQTRLERVVALKVLPPDVGRDGAFAERFAREARALARLDHPGIVAVYD